MKVYLVIEEGKRHHRILGIYTRPGAANHRAEEAAAHSDGRVEYDVAAANEDADIKDVEMLIGFRKIGSRVHREVKT